MAIDFTNFWKNMDMSGWSPAAQDYFKKKNGGGTATTTPTAPAAPPSPLEKMLAEAERLAGVEDTRFQTEYGRLGTAAADFSRGFEQDEDRLTRIQLGSVFDTIGRDATAASSRLRTQLGGRGIDPSSGTAAALAGQIGMRQQALKYGAARQATMDSYLRRNAQRTAQYAQQFNLAQFGNQSPSLLRLDALTNQAEYDLARDVSKDQLEAAKAQAKATKSAGKSAGIGNIIGGILGAI